MAADVMVLTGRGRQSPATVRAWVRGSMPGTGGRGFASLDWVPVTSLDWLEGLRLEHRAAVVALNDAVDRIPAVLEAVEAEAGAAARARREYDVAVRQALILGVALPVRPVVSGERERLALLDGMWADLDAAIGGLIRSVQAVEAGVRGRFDELWRTHLAHVRLPGPRLAPHLGPSPEVSRSELDTERFAVSGLCAELEDREGLGLALGHLRTVPGVWRRDVDPRWARKPPRARVDAAPVGPGRAA